MKDWTIQDVARLRKLIDEQGRVNAIKVFAKQTGRTENSVRIKLYRMNKEQIVMEAENKAYKELNDTKENKETVSWFSKIVNAFHKIW